MMAINGVLESLPLEPGFSVVISRALDWEEPADWDVGDSCESPTVDSPAVDVLGSLELLPLFGCEFGCELDCGGLPVDPMVSVIPVALFIDAAYC